MERCGRRWEEDQRSELAWRPRLGGRLTGVPCVAGLPLTAAAAWTLPVHAGGSPTQVSTVAPFSCLREFMSLRSDLPPSGAKSLAK